MEELVASINTSEMGNFPLRELVDMKVRLKADARRNNLEKDVAKNGFKLLVYSTQLDKGYLLC